MPKFAANLAWLFTEYPFLDRFEAAARAGFRAVEFPSPYEYAPETIAGKLRDHQLHNVLFNLPPGNPERHERGLASLPGREAEFRDSLTVALRFARILGTPRLHVMAGVALEPDDHAERRATYVANLRYAAAAAARAGVALVIEPINTRDMPGYFLNTQADAHAIREEVADANLKVQMDLYHAQVVEGDLATKLRRYLPHIGHIQIAGAPDRREPNDGEINYPYLFRLIDELGYAGWVGCEYRPAGDTVAGLGWMTPYLVPGGHP